MISMKKNTILHLLVLLLGFGAKSQELLTLENAVKIALENNYEITIAKNEVKIADYNNSIGNAGMLPNVSANVVNNNSILDTKQTQGDGTVRQLKGAKNMNLTYGVGLDWTVFDGLKMFTRKERFETLKQQGEANLKRTISTKISDVYATYFDLVQQQQQLQAIDTALLISNQRLTTAKNRYSIGKAAKLEVLNAEVDLNADISNRLKALEMYQMSKIKLNEILAHDIMTDFTVEKEINIDPTLTLQPLKEAAEQQNPELQAQILNKKIAELQLKETKGNRYPTVRINSGYNFTRSEASLGFVTQSNGNGFVYGISASMPIFNGMSQNRNEKIAKIGIENASTQVSLFKQNLHAQLASTYASYQSNLNLIQVEDKNVAIAKQNLDITLAKFKIGTITTIEFRTAQENYVTALVRLSNAKYLTKLAEISLKELAGTLNLN